MELFERNAYELSDILKNKEISSVELTKSVFDRIKSVENKVNSYVTLNEENALETAAEIDKKRANEESMSDLAGIPIGIKDNISTKGLKTTCSSLRQTKTGWRCGRPCSALRQTRARRMATGGA